MQLSDQRGITDHAIGKIAMAIAVTSAIAMAIGTFLSGSPAYASDNQDDWSDELAVVIAQIDREMPGNLGVYVAHLGDDAEVRHRSDRDWYLASTIKIPLGIVLLRQAEKGELSLAEELELADSDFVDGSGGLLWEDPGKRLTLAELNQRSIRDSDSTATDMLIRRLGPETLDRELREILGTDRLGPITTILQVRYDAWGEVHPKVESLSNRDFIVLSSEDSLEDRYRFLLDRIEIDSDQAGVSSGAEAFNNYYARGLNSGSLEAFGRLLERLIKGELLDQNHTDMLLGYMESVNTGDRRIKAGLPENARWAHKTGTQIARSCNVGILNPDQPDAAVVVAACAENYDNLGQAEQAFEKLGRALTEAGLVL